MAKLVYRIKMLERRPSERSNNFQGRSLHFLEAVNHLSNINACLFPGIIT
jgi:hypothetical protein